MYSAIQELFYGSYSASDLPTFQRPRLPGELAPYHRAFRAAAGGPQSRAEGAFEAYCENANAGHALMGEAYFAQGFSLGVRLLLEALHAPRPG